MQAVYSSSPVRKSGFVLSKSFYERDTRIVAFELIGKILVFEKENVLLRGRIVETESYLGSEDPASHAYRGVTPRNRVMFGPAGFSYVYFTYGFHYCLNIVTEKEGVPGAVLIRAVEPLEGLEMMKRQRSNHDFYQLTNGPAKLTQAYGIGREHSGLDITQPGFHVEGDRSLGTRSMGNGNLKTNGASQAMLWVGVSPRIGIREGKKLLYRFFLLDSPFVSGLSVGKRSVLVKSFTQ
ncbi:MAG: DNA-3-methyladenine glycosylase [Candidatus Omnitrophica bacterium]|nr:DNA-3-methyladenine glycosylase [Candidatus Omnitrophota bacterium]